MWAGLHCLTLGWFFYVYSQSVPHLRSRGCSLVWRGRLVVILLQTVRKILPITEICVVILQNVLVPLVVDWYKMWKRVSEMLLLNILMYVELDGFRITVEVVIIVCRWYWGLTLMYSRAGYHLNCIRFTKNKYFADTKTMHFSFFLQKHFYNWGSTWSKGKKYLSKYLAPILILDSQGGQYPFK